INRKTLLAAGQLEKTQRSFGNAIVVRCRELPSFSHDHAAIGCKSMVRSAEIRERPGEHFAPGNYVLRQNDGSAPHLFPCFGVVRTYTGSEGPRSYPMNELAIRRKGAVSKIRVSQGSTKQLFACGNIQPVNHSVIVTHIGKRHRGLAV